MTEALLGDIRGLQESLIETCGICRCALNTAQMNRCLTGYSEYHEMRAGKAIFNWSGAISLAVWKAAKED